MKQNDNFDGILNSGRNCLRYIIRANSIKKIHCSYYTCDVVWQTLKEENCEIEFYNIDKDFLPQKEFKSDDFIIYTNYFGVCSKQVKELTKKYKHIITDNAQAFYMPLNYGFASFNSARKFFSVTDGAFFKSQNLLTETFERYPDNEINFSLSDEFDKNFKKNENKLDENKEINLISNNSLKKLSSINNTEAKTKRLENFEIYHKNLNSINEIKLNLDTDDVPMVYPFWTNNQGLRKKLMNKKICLPRYWNNKFAKNILPLPLYQEMKQKEITDITEILKNEYARIL